MEIWHHVVFGKQDGADPYLDKLGITYTKAPLPAPDTYIIAFDITESDPKWPEVKELITERRALDIWETEFAPEEIISADWVRLMPTFLQGYPQPDGAFKWRDNAYAYVCAGCGIKDGQKEPFYLKKEPKMGKNDFVALYWIHKVFCTFKVLAVLEASQIKGYETRDALMWRTKQPSQTVKQLVIPHIADPGLADEDKEEPETCPVCGVTKYSYHNRGFMRMHRNALDTDADFQMTYEWFGSGSKNAFREHLVSRRVARLIVEQGWRGVLLKPVELV